MTMFRSFNCILDLSGSMNCYNKYRIAYGLLYAFRNAAQNLWPMFPWQEVKLHAWGWREEITPLTRDAGKPEGRCSLQALKTWLMEHGESEPVILLGDGHWDDLNSRREFADWIAEQPFQLAPVAIGPDADLDFLGLISFWRVPFDPADLAFLFQSANNAPLPMEIDVESTLKDLLDDEG